MSRTIIWNSDLPPLVASASGESGGKQADSYTDRMLKYIPAEVVSLHLFLNSLAGGATPADETQRWVFYFLLQLATPFYLWFGLKVEVIGQVLVSTLAFALWVAATGGILAGIGVFVEYPKLPIGFLAIFTFFIPIFKFKKSKA